MKALRERELTLQAKTAELERRAEETAHKVALDRLSQERMDKETMSQLTAQADTIEKLSAHNVRLREEVASAAIAAEAPPSPAARADSVSQVSLSSRRPSAPHDSPKAEAPDEPAVTG